MPALQEYLAIPHTGLRAMYGEARPRQVIVVGAGMAGLTAAYELLRAGHTPIILEAQQRIGGRIHTLREPFAPGMYGEAGAMRIPSAHTLTLAYLEHLGLPTTEFVLDNPQAYAYFNGQRWRRADVNANPDSLGFDTAPHERGKSAGQLWEAAIRPLIQRLEQQGDAAWPALVAQYDQYSVREFLAVNKWSEGAIELFGLLNNQEGLMNSSFLELFREEAGNYYTNMRQIPGGMDRFPQAFLPALQRHIRFGARMIALDQTPDQVTVHYQTAAGRFHVSGDAAIITLPFAVLRHVEAIKPFSRAKQRAIRQLHYDASAKIFLQCRDRFWETEDGIFGGGTVTDLPIRNLFYTNYGQETGRGVLLASYTWGEDAQRWGSLAPHERIAQALEDVAKIHPRVRETFETGASKMWHDDEYAGGAFALFDPEQQTLLYEHIIAPEGRIHFAGEHASLYHAWIQGAIESGLRAAIAIHRETAL